jgi:hypothetical protein
MANPGATGKAHLGFVSKYERGAAVPTGQTKLKFKEGDFDFESSAVGWLVVGGGVAEFTGTGTVNGAGAYAFQLACLDGDLSTPKTSDRIRLRIWDSGGGQTVYDSQPGAPANERPSMALGGGSVVVHAGASYQGGIDPLTQRPAAIAPAAFALRPIVPNPFADAVTIAFDVPVTTRVRIAVFDLAGRRVVEALDGYFEPGRRAVEWQARDRSGGTFKAGIYFVHFQARPLDGGSGLETVRRVVRIP